MIKTAQPVFWQKMQNKLQTIGLRPEILAILNTAGGVAWETAPPPDKPNALAYVSSDDLREGGRPVFHMVLPAIRRMLGDNPTDEEIEAGGNLIAETFVHEYAHVLDFDEKAEEKAQATNTEPIYFPGGEGIAEQAERAFQPTNGASANTPWKSSATNIKKIDVRTQLAIKHGEYDMQKELVTLSNHLDKIGHSDLADRLDAVIKVSQVTGVNPETNTVQTWLKSKPKTLQEFNAYLAALLNSLKIDQNLVDMSDLSYEIRNDPAAIMENKKVPSAWTKATGEAFAEFARLAGKPDAAKAGNWVEYAQNNPDKKYHPTLRGIFDFWSDNIEAATTGWSREQDTVMSADRKLDRARLRPAPTSPEEERRELARMDREIEDLKMMQEDYEEQDEWYADMERSQAKVREREEESLRHVYKVFRDSSPERRDQIMNNPATAAMLSKAVALIEGTDDPDTAIAQIRAWEPDRGGAPTEQSESAIGTMGEDSVMDKESYDKLAGGLVKLSNHLDSIGRSEFADRIDAALRDGKKQLKRVVASGIKKEASLQKMSSEDKIKSMSGSLGNIFSPIGSYKHVRR